MIRSLSRRLYMSNARSPREVCSTTMGTSGLIVLALVSLRRADSSTRLAGRRLIGGGPQPAGRSRAGRLLGPRRRLDALSFGGRRQGTEQLHIGDRHALRGHDRREHRLAAQGLLGLGLQLGQRLALV